MWLSLYELDLPVDYDAGGDEDAHHGEDGQDGQPSLAVRLKTTFLFLNIFKMAEKWLTTLEYGLHILVNIGENTTAYLYMPGIHKVWNFKH